MKITTGLIAILVTAFLVVIAMLLVLVLTGHDPMAFVIVIGTLLPSVAGFVALLNNQQKQGATIDTIKTQTNGTLSALTQRYDSAIAKLNSALGKLEPHDAQAVIDSTISKDQLSKLVDEASTLPVTDPATPVTGAAPSA